jgi:hypothetical protein
MQYAQPSAGIACGNRWPRYMMEETKAMANQTMTIPTRETPGQHQHNNIEKNME